MDNNLDRIVDIVVKKIEAMEDGTSSSIYNLVDENDRQDVDLFQVLDKVIEKLEEEQIELDYSHYDGMFVGVPYAIDFVKRNKKK